jgi:hypothetical protein
MRHSRYTKGVAEPENGVEYCGLKKVETAGPMIAADMITAPTSPTEFRRRPLPAGCAVDMSLIQSSSDRGPGNTGASPAAARAARFAVARLRTLDV